MRKEAKITKRRRAEEKRAKRLAKRSRKKGAR